MWSLTYLGRTVRLRDAKGLRDLACLLGAPGRAVPALELATVETGGGRARAAISEGLHYAGDLGERLDPTARAAYQRRIRDLDEDLSEAEGSAMTNGRRGPRQSEICSWTS